MTQPASDYLARYDHLVEVADRLQALIAAYLERCPRIDRISARAKDPDRFMIKAGKRLEDGSLKYADPINQIQDQIGARVIVYYRSDVEGVSTLLERYLQPVERRTLVPESDWEFGYFGKHWIFVLPGDVIPQRVERSGLPAFFELQVKTLFQHAWSEANHDLSYKPAEELSSDHRRRFAYTAAQAWGADQVFDDLSSELGS